MNWSTSTPSAATSRALSRCTVSARPARVAVVTGKATALNEDQAIVNVAADRFLKMCHLAGKPVQNICRKDQQLIYLALRQSQYRVDLITEDDILEPSEQDFK